MKALLYFFVAVTYMCVAAGWYQHWYRFFVTEPSHGGRERPAAVAMLCAGVCWCGVAVHSPTFDAIGYAMSFVCLFVSYRFFKRSRMMSVTY